jgi:hypothetical protein
MAAGKALKGRKVTKKESGAAAQCDPSPRARAGLSDQVLILLLSGMGTQAIAQKLRVNRQTVYRVRKSEGFEDRFETARSEALNAAIYSLHDSALTFAHTLKEICTNPKYRESARGSAARDGLASLWKAREIFDIESRLRKLEAAAAEAAIDRGE